MIQNLLDSKGEDRILLLSGGPKSHLARKSMFAKGMKKRLVITQPSIDPQVNHSPLNGETILEHRKRPMHGSLQDLTPEGWKVSGLISANSIEEMFRSLKSQTPVGSQWSGALSYDLVQWTQPIRLQYPPQEGDILAILWLVDEWQEDEINS